MFKVTESNLVENLEKLTKMGNAVIQIYRPDIATLSKMPKYQPYWSGVTDKIVLMKDGETLSMKTIPCITTDFELPENVLKEIIGHYRSNTNYRVGSVIGDSRLFTERLISAGRGNENYNMKITDFAGPFFPEVKGHGGYMMVYE